MTTSLEQVLKGVSNWYGRGLAATIFACVATTATQADAQRPVLPGTGSEIVGVADDFEDLDIKSKLKIMTNKFTNAKKEKEKLVKENK